MRIGSLFGVRVRFNPFFGLLLLVMAVMEMVPQALTLFGVVFLHEMAHVVSARGHGLGVTEVELLPFGGVARVDGLIELDPQVERSVAVAGPITNFVLFGIGLAFQAYDVFEAEWIHFFLVTNVVLGTFNLLPALPLDGGRIYRAYLVRRLGYRKATERAVRVGMLLACTLALCGGAGFLLGYLNLSVIILAFFLYVAARKEQGAAMYVLLRYLTRKHEELQRSGCIGAEAIIARPDATIHEVLARFVPQRYHLIWVLADDGKLAGLATEKELIDGLFEGHGETTVGELLQKR